MEAGRRHGGGRRGAAGVGRSQSTGGRKTQRSAVHDGPMIVAAIILTAEAAQGRFVPREE